MTAQSQIAANILKRTIEHMCAGPFDESREQAMDILNSAIETCFALEGFCVSDEELTEEYNLLSPEDKATLDKLPKA